MICKRSIRSHCSVLLQTIFLSTLVLVPLNAHAKTPVWKITKGDNHLYLGGTIHVLSRADYPLPAAFDATFATADEVIFETDVAALSRPAVQKELLSVMKFQDERTLADVLDDDTLAKLKAFLSDRSIAYTQFADFTPAGLSMTLVLIELQRLGLMDAPGVDSYFAQRAGFEGKQSGYLESIEEQLGFIEDMNKEDPNLIVQSSVSDVEELSSMWEKMLGAWRTGDMQALREIAIVPMQQEFPTMYEFLLVERNQNWIVKIKQMLTDPDTEFVLVGSLHMAGKDGLINMLQNDGYAIEQME